MSARTILRCQRCWRGFALWGAPPLTCPMCGGSHWVLTPRLNWLDRWRLWRQTGAALWTTPGGLPE